MMKKHLLALACLMAAPGLTASVGAQEMEGTTYGLESITLDGQDSYFYGILRVSDNGRYAVASDSEDSYAGVLWDAESKEFRFVNDYTGSKYDGVILEDVADDGMMVGGYPALVEDGDGGSYYCWHPGYKYLGGEWVDLPLPGNANLKYPMDLDYCSYATRVSPDGRVVCGEVYLTEERPDGTRSYWQPMLWYLDESGDLAGTRTFMGLEYGNQGFVVYDMNDDGSVIVGMVTSERGDFLPAMIRDGELVWLAGPDLVDEGGWWAEYGEDGAMKEYFWEGIANSIDGDGFVYYYYSDGDGTLHGVVENIYSGDRTEYDTYVSCGTGDFIVGMSTVLSGTKVDLSSLYTVMNMSGDATVLAGAGLGNTSWGEQFNYPALIVLDETPVSSGIGQATDDCPGIGIKRNGDVITVHGGCDGVELFSASGRSIARAGNIVNLGGLPAGVYILRVSRQGKTQSYKVAK